MHEQRASSPPHLNFSCQCPATGKEEVFQGKLLPHVVLLDHLRAHYAKVYKFAAIKHETCQKVPYWGLCSQGILLLLSYSSKTSNVLKICFCTGYWSLRPCTNRSGQELWQFVLLMSEIRQRANKKSQKRQVLISTHPRRLEDRHKEFSLSKTTMWDKPIFLNKSFSAAPTPTMKLKFYINIDLFMPQHF